MSYAGMAAQVVGGEMQGWAALLEKQAMAKQFEQEMARQEAFRQQGTGIEEGAILKAGRGQAEQDMSAGAAQRMADYSRIGAIPQGFGTTNAATQGIDQGYANMRGQSRAALGSYSDWSLQQAIRNLMTQQALNKVSSFAGGDARVFPFQMYKAQHSMDDLAMAGAAISSLGGGAANYSQFATPPPMQQSSGGGSSMFMPAYGSGYGAAPYGTYYDPLAGQNTYMPYNAASGFSFGGF